MNIPPIPPQGFQTHGHQSPKYEAQSLIDKILKNIATLQSAADSQNMDVIHQMRNVLDKEVQALSNLMNSNPGAFTKGELNLLNGGQGLKFFCQSLDNTYDNDYTEVASFGGAMFGIAKAMQESFNG